MEIQIWCLGVLAGFVCGELNKGTKWQRAAPLALDLKSDGQEPPYMSLALFELPSALELRASASISK